MATYLDMHKSGQFFTTIHASFTDIYTPKYHTYKGKIILFCNPPQNDENDVFSSIMLLVQATPHTEAAKMQEWKDAIVKRFYYMK